mgnify:CR=1 FL=1|tara:strand:+ start:516 stop:983 length:468 start_codon:yes stop_codon:yes gene_type:complete
MTPPRWLFFPTPQSTAAQYIYEVQTDRSVVRGSPQNDKRKQDSTGTESGSLADQFSPFANSTQFHKTSDTQIRFRTNNDDSVAGFETKTDIGNNLTSITLTVGGNVFTPDSVSIGGQNNRPRFDMNTSDTAAGTFWSDNNLDDTDNITITVTITF